MNTQNVMNKNFVEELRWRNMLHDVMPGTEDLLTKEVVKGYIGFDPTSDSLGVGNLVQIMTLLHFQRCGHKPVALVGGATGMVGDPSGKSHERNLLSEDVLQHNLTCIKKQLEKFLDFACGSASAELVNNYDWFKNFSFLDFIREVGKYARVSSMLAKDSVKNRMSSEEGMSFTEFTYQLVQGYDFYYLWKNHGVKLQMGGSDQWGNIVAGTELIHKKEGGEAFALTTPLIKKSDGEKFGKTAGGNVWLDPKKTSPYRFYQFWLNASDEDIVHYIRIFSLMNNEEILQLETQHNANKEDRILQKSLAKEITIRVHSTKDYETAFNSSQILFDKKSTIEQLRELPEDVLTSLDTISLKRSDYNSLGNITDLLSVATNALIFPSKSEARKMIQQGGVSINKIKLTIPDSKVNFELLRDKYLLVQKGKKNYYLIKIED
jgi:tyrosyl-tRNA synthetase